MMSSRFSPSDRRSRNSAPANTVQVELMRMLLVDFIAMGPSSCATTLTRTSGAASRASWREKDTIDTSREGFKLAMEISAYSLLALANHAQEVLADGASVLTLTYYGGEPFVIFSYKTGRPSVSANIRARN